MNAVESIEPLIMPVLDYDDINNITKLETALTLLNVFMENADVLSKYKGNANFVKSIQNVLTAAEGKEECLVSNTLSFILKLLQIGYYLIILI